jgi:hypothetical protein
MNELELSLLCEAVYWKFKWHLASNVLGNHPGSKPKRSASILELAEEMIIEHNEDAALGSPSLPFRVTERVKRMVESEL